MTKYINIGGVSIKPGERKKLYLDVAKLYDFTDINIPVEVIRGKKDGPVLFVSAALHGDEINGVEIIKRLLMDPTLNKLKGTLIAIPIVNVYGYIHKSRYLPDRRDLNRHFPGSPNGSLASQLAHIFMEEIVSKCTHGIDLHTGSFHRSNLPQIRACIDDPDTKALALAFNVPVVINSTLRDGSLREAARDHNIPILLYEGGEALRHDEPVIQYGLEGILSVMRTIGMITCKKQKTKEPFIARSSHWIRAPHSGSLRSVKQIGDHVKKGELLGIVSDPFGEHQIEMNSTKTGVIIGASFLPLVNRGDATFHIATFEDPEATEGKGNLYAYEEWLDTEPE